MTEPRALSFMYNGAPIGFRCREVDYASGVWDVYWYEKNLQGDIVAVYSATGTKLISYEYDAWGNFTTTYHYTGSSTANYNKFTYRGYYYDTDLKMYYLQSRYYDPATCRFISPDDTSYLGANGDLVSFNLYAYCSNDPVNNIDPSGKSIISIATVIIVLLAIVVTAKAIEKGIENEEQIVLDLSLTSSGYKCGVSLLLDFEGENVELYPHIGKYKGYSNGFTYSVGKVGNYDGPNSYKGLFLFSGGGFLLGYDGCFSPLNPIDGAFANSVTFSTSPSIYYGADYYFPAISFNYEEWRFN